jgi:hypothetical protein
MNPSSTNLTEAQNSVLRKTSQTTHPVDFCVVGGGMSGLCGAIAAARRGLRVALVQNRSMLGGNASSEIRQNIGGAGFAGHYPDAREGGVVDELWSALRRRAINASLNDYAESSIVFLDRCLKEEKITLFLNTQVDHVEVKGGRIIAVEGLQSTTGIRHRFEAGQFADCSGDAIVAHLGGAECRRGQEAAAEFGESLAPAEASLNTMGNTILFQTEKMDVPVPWERPDWAPDLSKLECYWTLHEPKRTMEHGSWIFEYGGQLDTIADAEKIHFELLKIFYAAWDDLKSRPECGMQNYRISFISALPGKRESRRIVGDHILTEGDVVQTRRFPDDVAYAGWALDLHPPEGFYGKGRPTTFHFFPEIHSIPLRSLYSKDLENLWMAGRNISSTHVALGGLRLMATCGVMGEAIGIAAAVAQRSGASSSRTVTRSSIGTIQQEILRGGGFIPGVVSSDPHDLARKGSVTSSGDASLRNAALKDFEKIGDGVGIAFPITGGSLERLTLAVRNSCAEAVELRAILRPIKTQRDFHGEKVLSQAMVSVAPGEGEATLRFAPHSLLEDLYMVHLHASDPALELGYSEERLTGVHAADFKAVPEQDPWARQLGMPEPAPWTRRFNPHRLERPVEFHRTPCFTLFPESSPYRASEVINGINRPTRLPNLWMAPMTHGSAPWLEIAWQQPQPAREVRLVFDTDMDLARPSIKPLPTLVQSYLLEGRTATGESFVIADVADNGSRLARHPVDREGIVSVRLTVRSMHQEGTMARLCEVRVLDEILA